MKKKILLIALVIGILKITSCEFGVEEEVIENQEVIINGQIIESITGNAIFNASVRLSDGSNIVNTTTNSEGKFSVVFNLTEDQEITLISFKQGYGTDTLSFFATIGSTVDLPVIQLKQTQGTGNSSSGGPASIYMYSQSSQSIGVKESGANETAQIIFEVLDSTGVPINSDNAITLNFRFGTGPGGGEYLYPTSVVTNALGRASLTINTGTIAGVAQVIAEMVIKGVTIKSKPVLIAIHGGFPDQDHFAVATQKLNYPAYGIIGYEIPFTAFAGDKYTNPVRPGTSVYFNASSGIIEGSSQTDDLGRATVTLLTQPFPNHQDFGAGFFEVTASTIGETQNHMETSTIRLLSGFPQISVSPTTFDIPNGGSQVFNYTVSDGNGNPLSEGATISVSVSEGDLKVTGNIDIRMPDTQGRGPGLTSFSFTAYDDKPDTTRSHLAIISLEVGGPNGETKVDISGTAR